MCHYCTNGHIVPSQLLLQFTVIIAIRWARQLDKVLSSSDGQQRATATACIVLVVRGEVPYTWHQSTSTVKTTLTGRMALLKIKELTAAPAKLRPKDAKGGSQRHPAGKWQSRDLNLEHQFQSIRIV